MPAGGKIRKRVPIALVAVLAFAPSCASHPDRPAPYRFVDHDASGHTYSLKIDGSLQRVLNPSESTQAFPLPSAAASPAIDFSVGVDPSAGEARVRFEITLGTPDAAALQLYQQEAAPGRWLHERVTIPATGAGATLTFRRTVVSGGPEVLAKSAWGNPLVLPDGSPTTATGPTVILISLDTLRADRLGSYGSTQASTPALDDFADSGALYERAYSPSTWTLPSHKSLLYGLFPIALDRPAARPLAGMLQARGYLTAGFTGGGFVSDFFGFDRGFDSYYMYSRHGGDDCGVDRFDGAEVFRRATEWLREHPHTASFLFIHTYDVHDTCPFRTKGAKPFAPRPDPGATGRAKELAYYNELVAKLDRLFDHFLDDLDALGLATNTLLVVTADHGEAFWEHGFRDHGAGKKPYEELTRVPLMLRWPAVLRAGIRVPEPVSIVAIPPTILALLGSAPDGPMHVAPLPGLGLRFPGTDWATAAVFRLAQRGVLSGVGGLTSRFIPPVFVHEGNLLAVRTARYKLITAKTAGAAEIYDLAADPGEVHNIVGRQPAVDEELSALAAAYWEMAAPSAAPTASTRPLDEETRERLRALGYVD
jgi:arylsulfatase A-like enzyme